MRRFLLGTILAIGLSSVTALADHHINPSVRKAQEMLKEKGYYTGTVDGQMGPQTRAAIRKYQKENDMTVDGRFTRATAEKMGVVQGNEEVGEHFENAGSDLKRGYGSAGSVIGSKSKQAGSEYKQGEITEGTKDLGVGLGKGISRAAKGTGKAAADVGRGIKDAFDGDEKERARKKDHK